MYIAKNDNKRPKLTKEVDIKDDKDVYSPFIFISDYYDFAPSPNASPGGSAS